MESLSRVHGKEFVWKFSATSHGKGIVDGVGGNVKPTVRQKSMSKGKDKVIVQDSKSFAEAASKLISTTKIIHVEADEIENVKRTDPYNNVKPVKGISSSHIISVYNDCLKLWCNAVSYNSVPSDNTPDLICKEKSNETSSSSDKLSEIPFCDVNIGMWAKVIYEEEVFLGKVTNVCQSNGCEVRCLNLPYAIGGKGTEFEREMDKIFL